MSGITFTEHGKPEEVLSLSDVDFSSSPAAGHVRIAVKAAAVNPADVLFVEGLYNALVGDKIAVGEKQVGGSECAGVIHALGEGVDNFKVGDHVYASAHMPKTGTWATYYDVAADAVVPLPPKVPFEQACQLLVNPLTALGFLWELGEAKVTADDFFVMSAGGSALCRQVLQLQKLKKVPGKAICVVRREAVKEELLALGAHAVIATNETPDVALEIQKIVEDAKLKVFFDALGGGAIAGALIDQLSNGGRCFVYGVLDTSPLTFNTGRLLFAGTSVKGWWLGVFLQSQNVGALLGEVVGYLASDSISFSSVTFDLKTQHKEAIQHTLQGSKGGKTVLTNP